MSRESFLKEAKDIVIRVLHKLREAGLTVGSDLMYLTDDLFNPLIQDIEGIRRGWLVRFYENNFFVRNAILESRVSLKEEPLILKERIEFIKAIKADVTFSEYILAVPGPLTLSVFTKDASGLYSEISALANDYMYRVLTPLIDMVCSNDIGVEVHEPEAVYRKYDESLLRPLYEGLKDFKCNVHLVTYFGLPYEDLLFSLPTNITFGVDMTLMRSAGDRILQLLRGLPSLRLGVVDSYNTKIESVEDVMKRIPKQITDKVHYLSTNTLTEFLPETVALRKIRLLKKVKERMIV